MDDGRFDDLTRTLARSRTRRASLRALAGGALAGGLTWLGMGEAEAACKPARKRCKRNKNCCSNKCTKRKNGKKKCRGNGPTCLKNRTLCFDSDECCSEFCGTINGFNGCCVPNNEICDVTGDCCVTVQEPATCENGRCCVVAGGTCATPDGQFPTTTCCAGLVCDVDGTHQCVEFGIGT
jgi:hypothetical protein